ncbi:MAG: DUF2807 domain-containing protein [Bacteroidales bacterium]|jgi:hypothetical protein|nr:DUF2807 domain-containing protein [Bacteroidales bacterium]
MKKLLMLLTVMIFTVWTYAQNSEEKITEDRILNSFNRIGVSSFVNVEIITGKPQRVIVCGEKELVQNLITEVKNNELQIWYQSPKKKQKKSDYGDLTVKICVENLTDLSTSGAVNTVFPEKTILKKLNIRNSGATKTTFKDLEVLEHLLAEVSGASTLDINGSNFSDVEIGASGASNIEFSGTAKIMNLGTSGASNIRLSGYADEISVRTSGASSVTSNRFSAEKKSFSSSGASGIFIGD